MPDRMRKAVETVLGVWGSGDVDRLDAVCATSCVFHTPPFGDMDLAAEKEFIRSFRTGLPDFAIEQVEGIVSGETTCHRYHCCGTHTGFNPADPRGARRALVRDHRLLDGPLGGRQSRGSLALPALDVRTPARVSPSS